MGTCLRRHHDLVTGTEHQKTLYGKTVAENVEFAAERVDGTLFGIGGDLDLRARRQPDIGIERVRCLAHRRLEALEFADDETAGSAVCFEGRQHCRSGVLEHRRGLFLGVGQGQPGLQTRYRHRRAAQFFWRALGMDDAAAGGHQVHVTGRDHHLGAERIAMPDLAVEQVGDGGEADMRMRAHVERMPGPQDRRPHAIEEDEGPDQPALCRRQRAAHLEAVNVLGVRHHHQLDLIAGKSVARCRVFGREKTHDCILS